MNDDGPALPEQFAVTDSPCSMRRVRPVLTIHGGEDWAARIRFDPPSVEVNTGLDWDGAAKHFWNAVARMAGQKPPFGW